MVVIMIGGLMMNDVERIIGLLEQRSLTVQELCELTNIGINTIRMKISRARRYPYWQDIRCCQVEGIKKYVLIIHE